MCQIFVTCYSTLSILTRYKQKWYNDLMFFILFSLSSLFTLFISLLSHSSLDIKPLHSFLLSLFFLLNLVVFLSSSQTSPLVFSSHFSSFIPIFVAMVFFFFFPWFDTRFSNGWVEMLIGKSLVVGCDGQIQWWVGRLVIGESMVVGSVVRNRWWEDRPVNGFQRMGRGWVGWQRQWVGVWDALGGGSCVLILVVFFFFFCVWLWPQQFF